MKYAIISDVHANLMALDTVLADAAAIGVERAICLGDIVGYGPQPAEALNRVRNCCQSVIAGNHDDAISGRGSAADFINLAGEAAARHRQELSRDDKAYLAALPYTAAFGEAIAAHGDFVEPEKFYYVENEDDAKLNFEATAAQLMFVGHTHVPCIFVIGNSGRVHRLPPQDFTLETGKRYIVNPGSVGYPRETGGKCLSSYIVYDDTERTVTFRQLPFAISSVMQRGGLRRRLGKLQLAIIALCSLLALLTALFALRTQPSKTPPATPVIIRNAETSPLAEKSITLAPSTCFVRPSIRLAKGSSPALMLVTFKNSLGECIGAPISKLIKRTSEAWLRIPESSISAHVTISAVAGNAAPEIETFELTAAAERPAKTNRRTTSR